MSDARRPVVRNLDTGIDKPITELWAWIIDDERGGQALPSAQIGDLIFPLIGADRARVESYRQFAVAVRISTARPVRLVRFSNPEIIEALK